MGGMHIADGKGRGYLAEVNPKNEMVVRAITEPEIEEASEVGDAYTWDSAELDIDAGDTMLFVKNTGDKELHVVGMFFNGSNVVCTWDIGLGDATTTPVGTTVTPVNLNRIFSTRTADTSALSDETAVADADVFLRVKTAISEFLVVPLSGVILGKNHYIQINQETESTSGSVILVAHFE